MAYNPNDVARLKHVAQLAQVVKSNQDDLLADISGKVDKVNGKGLSTNDYTTTEKNKLASIAAGAQVNVIETVKVNGTALTPSSKAVNIDISGKVDKVNGKGLSTNDYTTTEKNKLAGIADNANNYSLPVATTSTIGGVKVDSVANSNIVLSSGGNISVPAASTSQAGVVKLGGDSSKYLNGTGQWATPTNTTYAVATSSANGLMSANDKKILDSVPSVYETKANAITGVAVSGQKLTFTKGNGSTVTLQTQDTNTDTNTHYTTKLIVGASNSTVNAATTNGNTYIRLFDDTTARESHKISGSGATTVTSDSSGNIVVNSTNTTYAVATSSANGLMSANDKKTLDSVPSVYANLTGAQTISGNKTFTGATVIYSKQNTKPSQGQGLYVCGADANEGGQINLCAPDSGTTFNGIILDNYQGNLRLLGIPSADGSTRTGIGKTLYINPYTRTIAGGYTFTGDVNGNCSGSSGSCTGNAATATKFASAQTITLAGDVTGSVSSQAGWTITTTRRSCSISRDGTTTKPWYKIATYAVLTGNLDKSISFLVEDTYYSNACGILRARISSDGSKMCSSSSCALNWLVCGGFALSDFVLVVPTTASPTVELWTKMPWTWFGRRFTVLSEGDRTTAQTNQWTLLNCHTAGGYSDSITTAGEQIVSSKLSI